MSEFTVTGVRDEGYGVTMATTGARVAEKIHNLPFPIEVITAEFLDDLGFTELGDDFAYVSSFGAYEAGGGSMMLRGLGTGKQLRNGFLRIGSVDQTNIERVEIIKGPSAAIYGESLPSGLVNIVTKKPKNRRTVRLSTRAGTNNLLRIDAEATGPLASRKTSYIVNFAYLTQDYDQEYTNLTTRVYSAAVQHKFSKDSSLLIEAEYIDRRSVNSAAIPVKTYRDYASGPGTYSGTFNDVNDSLAMELAGFNYLGPSDRTNRSILTYTATYEQRFNEVFSLRASGNYFKRDFDGVYANVLGGVEPHYLDPVSFPVVADPVHGRLRYRIPAYGFSDEHGYGAQVDVLAHYWMFNRKIENRTLFTLDFSNFTRRDPQYRLANNALNRTMLEDVGYSSVFLPWDPDLVAQYPVTNAMTAEERAEAISHWRLNPTPNYFFPDRAEYPDLYPLYRYNNNRTDIYGAFLRHQTAAFNGRLIVVGGIRYDYVKENLRRETEHRISQGAISIVDRGQGQFTPSGGINFAITDNVRGYGNYANSFFIQSQSNNAPQYGVAPDNVNEGGYGFDYGIKADIFKGRLKFTLGGFYVVRENVRVTDEDGVTRRIGVILSRGLELDATARIKTTRTVTDFRFGYGFTNALYTNAGNDIDRKGRRMAGVPEHNAYIAITHRRQHGFLKGARISVGVTYTGSTYPMTDRGGQNTTIYGDIYVLGHSGYRDIRISEYFNTRASIAYEWKLGKWRHEISLSATNLLDNDSIIRTRRLMESFTLSAAYVIKL